MSKTKISIDDLELENDQLSRELAHDATAAKAALEVCGNLEEAKQCFVERLRQQNSFLRVH